MLYTREVYSTLAQRSICSLTLRSPTKAILLTGFQEGFTAWTRGNGYLPVAVPAAIFEYDADAEEPMQRMELQYTICGSSYGQTFG